MDDILSAVNAAFPITTSAAASVTAEEVSEAARTLANSKTKAQAQAVTFKSALVDHGVIYGVAASVAVDHENETVEKGAIVQMAYDFCGSDVREFRANHGEVLKAKLVASMPGKPIYASDGVTITGVDLAKGEETHWIVGVKPEDPAIYEAAKSGAIGGFSWAGHATKGDS